MTLHRRAFLSAGVASLAAPMVLTRAKGANAQSLAQSQSQTVAAPRATPLFSRRRLGAFEVTVLLDGTVDIDPSIIVGYDQPAATSAYARQNLPSPTGAMAIPVLGYVIDTGAQRIAVDMGTVAGISDRLGQYHQALAQAGFTPDDIDTVLLTHLHFDHVGGLTRDGARVFDKAQVHVHQDELNFWQTAPVPDQMAMFFDAANGAMAPYDGRIVTFAKDQEILPGVQAVPLPGHTPGHSGFRFHSQGQDLLIWGDIIHLTKLQFDNPDWLVAFDMDKDQTAATRHRMLDMAATDRLLVAGSHLDFPGAGYVERAAGAYRFVTAPHDYMI